MGWSESYYADMRSEAERELRRCSLPLLEALEGFQEAIATYRDFAPSADELEALLRHLERMLLESGLT